MSGTKLTSKYQATIPKNIRDALRLKAGDTIVFYIDENGSVIVKKALPLDKEYLRSLNNTLTEWNSKEDDETFADLQSL